MTRKIKKN